MQVWFYYSFVPSKRLFFWGNSLVFKHEVTYCDWNFNDLLVKNILAAFLQHHNTLIWFVLYKVTQYTFLASAQLHKAQGFEVLFLSLCLNRELPRLSLQLLKYEDVCKQGCVCVCVLNAQCEGLNVKYAVFMNAQIIQPYCAYNKCWEDDSQHQWDSRGVQANKHKFKKSVMQSYLPGLP